MAAAISRGSTLACPGGVSDGGGRGAVPLSPFFFGVAASLLPTAAGPVAAVVAAGGLGAAGCRGWSLSEAPSEDEAGGCSSGMFFPTRLRACLCAPTGPVGP